ncbi:MAG: NAD(P)-dependent oxidoreductase, partial [Planctomycetota bacterium JB042]
GLLRSVEVPPEVEVTRVTGVFGAPIADYVLARCLAIAQELPRLEVERRDGGWRSFHARLLSDLRVAVVGTGEIGAAVARRLIANGVEVVGVNRSGGAVDGLPRVEPVARLREVVADVDVLVLVVPRTTTSERLVDAALLAALPPRAWLVNVARGAVVDEAALIAALRAGRLAGAALDVFEVEPLPADSPLRTLPNVMVSPHVAGVTTPTQAADAYLENLRRRREGLPRRGVIDRERGY